MVQPTLQEMSLKEVHEPFSSNGRGPIHEERRLQIEELDEWRTHKPRTHDKPELCQNKLNTFLHQLKEHERVLNVRRAQTQNLRITRAEIGEHGHVTWPCAPKSINRLHYSLSSSPKNPNPSRRKSTCPPRHARTMSFSHGKKAVVPASKKRKGASSSSGPTAKVRHPFLRFPIGPQEEIFQILQARPLIEDRYID
ncbi:hypothetical protein GOBAR_AA25927 [Gossypium barbadense]|uniref:Uncharacterized protein n=1 Tax=Gossypium barbadense TaxID=3634 RepID=A0A2P5WUH0_GOSBA|nr:hypothetical protein GOBAR_AA25927 [Gossypium barbadense]